MDDTALLVMDVQQGIVARFNDDAGYLGRLRSLGVSTLVLTGIATSGVVLSTLRQAADLDYQITVLADACLDADPEVHRVLTEKVFIRQAEVLSVGEWKPAPSREGRGGGAVQ